MGTILDLIQTVGRQIKTWFLITDALNRLTETYDACQTNIELMRGHLESLNTNVKSIEEHGSKGAQNFYDTLDRKFDILDTKLDKTQQDVAKIQGFLKMNGNGVH